MKKYLATTWLVKWIIKFYTQYIQFVYTLLHSYHDYKDDDKTIVSLNNLSTMVVIEIQTHFFHNKWPGLGFGRSIPSQH